MTDETMVRSLGDGRFLADLGFRDREGLIASYFLRGPEGWTVVECGPASCLDRLLAALAAAGIGREEVDRVFVTHIHLDHAGGLGALAERLPKATLYAHASGVDHLVDPTRLIASARRAWGPAADPLWGPIRPVPSGRLQALRGEEAFPLVGGRLLVVATPGHARHHLSYFDERTGSVMTGDSAGVRLEGSRIARPAIPPPDLDLGALFESLDRMAALNPRRLLYAHFGETDGGAEPLRRYRREVEAWRDVALEAARAEPTVAAVATRLRAFEEAREAGATEAAQPDDRADLISGVDLAAQGLLRYFQTHGLLPE